MFYNCKTNYERIFIFDDSNTCGMKASYQSVSQDNQIVFLYDWSVSSLELDVTFRRISSLPHSKQKSINV